MFTRKYTAVNDDVYECGRYETLSEAYKDHALMVRSMDDLGFAELKCHGTPMLVNLNNIVSVAFCGLYQP